MPVASQFGGRTIGRDASVHVTLPSGAQLEIEGITDFDAKPKQKKLESHGLDGIVRTATIPGTWTLTFSVDRSNSIIDDFFAAVEDAYFQGQTVNNCTINQVIIEPDGAVSTFRYEGVSLHFEDAGSFKADSFVKMKLGGEASRRVKAA